MLGAGKPVSELDPETLSTLTWGLRCQEQKSARKQSFRALPRCDERDAWYILVAPTNL